MLQCVANTLTHCNTLISGLVKTHCNTLQHTPAHSNTSEHTCNTPAIHLQYTCNGLAETCVVVYERVCCSVLLTLSHTLQHTYIRPCQNTLQYTATHCNALQHTCNTPETDLAETCVALCVAVCCCVLHTLFHALQHIYIRPC